ncbi:hypothetical protein JL721_6747 [Aureococcus anophagefferens]|nr:hypothetical protein JL721_6747 [Aureococcus anophagefferens]
MDVCFAESVRLEQDDWRVAQAYHLAPLTPTEAKPFAGVRWQCSCNNFWHYGKCKHSLAWAISRGEMTVPAIYRIDRIGDVRKRGRPKKAKGGEALSQMD